MKRRIHNILLLCLVTIAIGVDSLKAEYTINGKINLNGNWQNQIFLATIDKLDNYYKADPSYIINVATIDNDGSFTLKGDNLPEEKQYYRLFLIKEENSEFDVCLYVGGDDHNFVHIILDNQSRIDIQTDSTYLSPFGNYTIKGDHDNIVMRELNRLVLPSYYFYQIKFPSELQFSQDKLNRDLIAFADTCTSTLVGLAALNNIDMDNYFELNETVFAEYSDRMKTTYDGHPYTQDLSRKLVYYTNGTKEQSVDYWPWVALMLLTSTLFLFSKNITLKKQARKMASLKTNVKKTLPSLTNQEQKILDHIIDGKSNKEIASELYVELSTVKTHINKLYSKLGVNNRNEAIKQGKQLRLHT